MDLLVFQSVPLSSCSASSLLSLRNKVNAHNQFKLLFFLFCLFFFNVNILVMADVSVCVCVCVCVIGSCPYTHTHTHTHTHAARERCPPSVVLKCAHHRSAFCFTRLPVKKRKWLNCLLTVVQECSPATQKLRTHAHAHAHTHTHTHTQARTLEHIRDI